MDGVAYVLKKCGSKTLGFSNKYQICRYDMRKKS